ncbi:MAG: energy transducer TonB [Atribacterota bacterium]|jgi:TonB family protein|nr:energy transducer TonB [Atribacterota bacterium]
MENRIFIIALIISSLFHYWAITLFSNISVSWQSQEEKREIVLSASIEFLKSDSLSLPFGKEDSDIYLNEPTYYSETISTEEVVFEQEDIQTENIIKDKTYDTEQGLLETKEVVVEHTSSHNSKIDEQDNKEKKQDTENVYENLVRALDKKENYQNTEQSLEIINQETPLLKEAGTNSIQEDSPLDLTKIDLVDKSIIAPEVISYYPPAYPNNLRRRGIEGKVQIKALIDKEGGVIEILIDTSSGYQSFDQNAIEAILKWKFKPAYYSNEKRLSWVFIPVVFKLK